MQGPCLCTDGVVSKIQVEFLPNNHIDVIHVVVSQGSREQDNSKVHVPGHQWFGDLREGVMGKRGP